MLPLRPKQHLLLVRATFCRPWVSTKYYICRIYTYAPDTYYSDLHPGFQPHRSKVFLSGSSVLDNNYVNCVVFVIYFRGVAETDEPSLCLLHIGRY